MQKKLTAAVPTKPDPFAVPAETTTPGSKTRRRPAAEAAPEPEVSEEELDALEDDGLEGEEDAEEEETEEDDSDEAEEGDEEEETEEEEVDPSEVVEPDEEEEDEESEDFLNSDDDDDDEGLAGSNTKTDPGSFGAQRKAMSLDFTGSGDKPPTIPPGDYYARVKDVEMKESSSGNPMLEWTFQIVNGAHKNASVRFWSSLKPDARWASARVLKALGQDVAGKVFQLDPKKLENKPCILAIVADTKNEDFPYRVNKVKPADVKCIKACKAATDLI